jgi:DGQHR domain-containing protein
MADRPSKKSKKASKKPKRSAEERRRDKIQKDHIRSARSVFRNLGFERADELSDKEISFGGQSGDFDDCFVYENLIVFAEYTMSQPSGVTDHLKKKKILFSNVLADEKGFLAYLRQKFPAFDAKLGERFHFDKLHMRIVYCSFYEFDSAVKGVVHEPKYMDYPFLKYFEKLAAIIKMSALQEMFEFLEVEPISVAKNGVFPSKSASETYDGSILPESASGFPPGYKVVSFYADAAALLSRSYVLRRDGWRSSFQAYQRMVQSTKIDAIRKKLKNDGQVFVNNLIATLPPDVHPVDRNGKTVDISKLTNTEPVKINLPLRANSIGLIDGQHRLYSYFESKDDDPQIAKLRNQQNLLVTGIIYPEGVNYAERERFEAKLFISINSNQTNAETSLRQEIGVFLEPFSQVSIGKQVMQCLAKTSPLCGHVEAYFFDKGKLKTTSIVSYGLGPLIKLGGTDSLYCRFEHLEKNLISTGQSQDCLDAYIRFCASQINSFLNAFRMNISAERWTSDPRTEGRLLTVTVINCLLITMRLIIQAGKSLEFEQVKTAFRGVSGFPFSRFHSSQYGRMAEKMFETYFADGQASLRLDEEARVRSDEDVMV